jgi:hypothetical protein
MAWHVKRKITLVRFFLEAYLRNDWSVNLRVIENCIFSIRSIERNRDEAHFMDSVAMLGTSYRTGFVLSGEGYRNNFAPHGADHAQW